MVLLQRKQTSDGSWEFWTVHGYTRRFRTHPENDECREMGCVLHNPSDTIQNHENWPYNWREDRGIMERVCYHGVGHPDIDSARFLARHDRAYDNVHGCDLCCLDLR